MTDSYPTREKIAEVANRVMALAAEKRAKYELAYGKEQNESQERDYREHGMQRVEGQGTRADYEGLRAGYAWIPKYFDDAIGPELGKFQNLIEASENAAAALVLSMSGNPSECAVAGGHITYVTTEIGQWHGHLTDALRQNFIPKLNVSTIAQANVAMAMGNAIKLYQAALIQSRNDLLAIGNAAVEALSKIDCWGGGDASIKYAKVSAVATVIAGIATIPITGGASAGVVVAASVTAGATISAGLTAFGSANEATANATNARPLGADTVDGVLNNMTDAIKERVVAPAYDADMTISQALSRGYNALFLEAESVLPPAVDISSATAGNRINTDELTV